jgi:ribonuclease HII
MTSFQFTSLSVQGRFHLFPGSPSEEDSAGVGISFAGFSLYNPLPAIQPGQALDESIYGRFYDRKVNTMKIREALSFVHEEALRRAGYGRIAGVDEAGRGPLAGPVVAAAVILPQDIDPHLLAGIRDSKELNEGARERFYEKITQVADAFAVEQASPREIEALDIRKASLLAMKRAVEKLPQPPEYVLVDGKDYPGLEVPGEALVKGDQKSITIGAASIVAKVIRDRIMRALDSSYPLYGLAHHKGYPTAYHCTAVELFGGSELHRKTFCRVKEFLQPPPLRPEFREWLERVRRLSNGAAAQELLDRVEAASLPEPERFYLEHTIGFLLERLHHQRRNGAATPVETGSGWETFAIHYLEEKGYRLWERNFRIRGGEIDLIVNRGTEIVFVEVKARRNQKFGLPYESITRKKKEALIRTAESYLYRRGLLDGWDIRYDVISILAAGKQPPQIEHFEDAFRVEEDLG